MAIKLIASIYYGVSYAWSDAQNASDVFLITKWGYNGLASGAHSIEKQVPSKITYGEQHQWGSNTEPGVEAFFWAKLLLDKHASATEFDDKRLREVDGSGILTLPVWKPAEQVFADYMTHIYAHVMEQLAGKTSKEILAVTAIEFWFTVHAMWSVRAQEATRKAACKAGFGSRTGDTVHMIKEPEAAAISCLSQLVLQDDQHLIEPGNGILVCDCGGGTVYLASYVTRATQPKLVLDQACVSEGGKCGSTTIDRVHGLMQTHFEKSFDEVKADRKGANSKFMQAFDYYKRNFGSSQFDKIYRIFLKIKAEGSGHYDAEEQEVLLTRCVTCQ
ncbi:molecular chaperone HscA [Microdochium nivale]|nr:molecular chaperone HscA [Microdochium nivale]